MIKHDNQLYMMIQWYTMILSWSLDTFNVAPVHFGCPTLGRCPVARWRRSRSKAKAESKEKCWNLSKITHPRTHPLYETRYEIYIDTSKIDQNSIQKGAKWPIHEYRSIKLHQCFICFIIGEVLFCFIILSYDWFFRISHGRKLPETGGTGVPFNQLWDGIDGQGPQDPHDLADLAISIENLTNVDICIAGATNRTLSLTTPSKLGDTCGLELQLAPVIISLHLLWDDPGLHSICRSAHYFVSYKLSSSCGCKDLQSKKNSFSFWDWRWWLDRTFKTCKDTLLAYWAAWHTTAPGTSTGTLSNRPPQLQQTCLAAAT